MKINAPLDLAGNELKNFIVHNGDTSAANLPAEAGRFVYDTTNKSMYFGAYNDGTKKWVRLVDTEHLDVFPIASLSNNGLMSKSQVFTLEKSQDWKNQGYLFIVTSNYTAGTTKYSGTYSCSGAISEVFQDTITPAKVYFSSVSLNMYISIAGTNYGYIRSSKTGEVFPSEGSLLKSINTLYVYTKSKWVPVDFEKGATAYSWGDHSTKGYTTASEMTRYVEDRGFAKAYKVDRVLNIENNEVVLGAKVIYDDFGSLMQGVGGPFSARGVVYDINTNEIYLSYFKSSTAKEYYIKLWYAGSGYEASNYIKKDGVLLFVKGNSTVYRRESDAWVEYFSGASQDVIDKIDEIREALGLDEDSDDIIDTWNEIKEYFANLEEGAGSEELLAAIATKADKDKVVEKPSVDGNYGDVLSLEYYDGAKQTVWKKTKIVKSDKNEYLDSEIVNGEWCIDITELGNILDVNVSLYRVVNQNQREMVLADVYVEKVEVDEEAKYQVRVVFGNYDKTSDYIAVITA